MSDISLLLELDEVEARMGTSADQMDVQDLLTYIQEHFKKNFGYSIAVSGHREMAVIKWLKKVYGSDAGTILKWLFLKHNGQWKGEPFAFTRFGVNSQWRVDAIREEMYAEIHKEQMYIQAQRKSGLASW